MSNAADEKKKPSLLTQVSNELRETKLKQLKGDLKKLMEDRQKAIDTVDGIDDKIVELLVKAGETPEAVREMLQG